MTMLAHLRAQPGERVCTATLRRARCIRAEHPDNPNGHVYVAPNGVEDTEQSFDDQRISDRGDPHTGAS